jgi:hypothetical protein
VKFRISFVEDVINKNDGDGGGQTTTIITFTQQQGALSAFNQACERFRDMHDSPGLINMK